MNAYNVKITSVEFEIVEADSADVVDGVLVFYRKQTDGTDPFWRAYARGSWMYVNRETIEKTVEEPS